MTIRSAAIREGIVAPAMLRLRGNFRTVRMGILVPIVIGMASWLLALHPMSAHGNGFIQAATTQASAGEVERASPLTRGFPLILAADTEGGVWYGGPGGGGRLESPERVDYITPAGGFLDFPFVGELEGSPEYFASGANGQEWFLVDFAHGLPFLRAQPALGEISRTGTLTVHPLAVGPQSELRGLAMGPDGDLWTTETHLQGDTHISAILRVTPAGTVTAFNSGLQKGSTPVNITAGPENALWFIDEAGYIGRISTDGAIHEFRVGLNSVPERILKLPRAIVAGPDESLWFIAGPQEIGRMTTSGHATFYTPVSSYLEPEPRREPGELSGLATGPEGDVWLTRTSGEVARIDEQGHVMTITNRLEAAYGIAFGSGGAAWIGEGARSVSEAGANEGRVARITASGQPTQYPEPPPCRASRVLGDGPHLAAEELRRANCEVASVKRPPGALSNRLIVVSQSVRPGALLPYKTPVRLTLGPKPPTPKTCRAPLYSRVLVASKGLVAWVNPLEELDNQDSYGEGSQTYFACVPPRGVKRRFYTKETDLTYYQALDTLHAAGHFLAFTASWAGHYNHGGRTLTVFATKRGRAVFRLSYSSSAEERGFTDFGAFVVDAHGDVAWVKVVTTGSNTHLDTLEVQDNEGTHAVETGTNITNLAIRHRVLTWKSAKESRSRALG